MINALQRTHRAFSLVEVTLTIGMVSIGLLAVIGLLGTSLQTGRETSEENRAVGIAHFVFDDLRNDAKNGKMADTVGSVLAPTSIGLVTGDFGPKIFAAPPLIFYCSFDANGQHLSTVAGNPGALAGISLGSYIAEIHFSPFLLSSSGDLAATRVHMRVFPFAPFMVFQNQVGNGNTAIPPRHYSFETITDYWFP